MKEKEISLSLGISAAEPLWRIAPTRDEAGNRASDLLMIIPRLKSKPQHHRQRILSELELALTPFRQFILLVNVDMKLNTLWISFQAQPGLFAKIITAVKLYVPEAVLVGETINPLNK